MNLPTLVEALDFLLEQGATTPLQALESLRVEAQMELRASLCGLDGAEPFEVVARRLLDLEARSTGENVIEIEGKNIV